MNNKHASSFLKRISAAFLTAAMLCVPGTSRAAPTQENCYNNNEITSPTQTLYHLYQGFRHLQEAPLTGQPLYDVLKNPANGIQSCIVPDETFGPSVLGAYFTGEKKVKFYSSVDLRSFLHEGFHAQQQLNGSEDFYKLQDRDLVAGTMFLEATAVAYTFVYFKETNFPNTEYSVNLSHIFEKAYKDALKSLKDADPQVRKEKSLEMAGKTVVRTLLGAEDSGWTTHYVAAARRNIARSAAVPKIPVDDGYAARRDAIYSNLGRVSAKINLMPDEFLGPDADRNIELYLQKSGYQPSPKISSPVQSVVAKATP